MSGLPAIGLSAGLQPALKSPRHEGAGQALQGLGSPLVHPPGLAGKLHGRSEHFFPSIQFHRLTQTLRESPPT